MSQALYRKYRSKSLQEIVGQEHITHVLLSSLSSNRITHAYLLTGPRGVGKTSIARILAHEINKLPYDGTSYLDIIEIDAASNNGVEDIRDLRDKATITPVSAAYKVYIIDEVHMLSKPAFNALLKTLEEPPAHVVFILATTEVHKLPDTILSRTQRFHFRAIEPKVMTDHLKQIAKKEKIAISQAALELIAYRAKGSFRDGISLLDQLRTIDAKEITPEHVARSLGIAEIGAITDLADAIISQNLTRVVELVTQLESEGVSAVITADQLSTELKSRIIDHPEVINIIESLIDVGRSFDPQLKLLAITSGAAVKQVEQKPKTVNLTAKPHDTVVATIEAPKQKHAKTKDTPQHTDKNTSSKNNKSPESTKKTYPEHIDWAHVLEKVRVKHPALYGVIHKAEATYQNHILSLHFSYALHKKKVDDSKYRQSLTEVLIELYKSSPDIVTTNGKKAPSDKKAREVAAIMGGGEEVII